VTLCATKTYKLGAADSRDFTIWEAKQFGTGIRKVYKYSKAYSGKEEIEFLEQDIFITKVPLDIRFFEAESINGELNGDLSERQLIILNAIKNKPGVNATTLAVQLNIPFSSVDKYIRFLTKKQMVGRRGSRKTGGYYTR
jgi:ATP-dependent DNA helicase RecG